jgi:Tfp pilus assembly protein PilO
MIAVHPKDGRYRGLCRIDVAGIGICAAAALLFSLTTVAPLVAQRAVTARRRGEMQTQAEKASQLKAVIAKVRERLAAVRQEQAACAVQLDPAAHINRRVAGLTEFFSACGLQVDDVQTGRVSSTVRYDLVPITITGKGPYQQCLKFFRGLCSVCPDMSLIRIELTGNPARPAEPEQFRFDLFWYAAPSSPAPNASSNQAAGKGMS